MPGRSAFHQLLEGYSEHIPKGEEIENYSDEFIQWVEDYVNSMPMAVLGFRTPDAVWNDPSFMRKAA